MYIYITKIGEKSHLRYFDKLTWMYMWLYYPWSRCRIMFRYLLQSNITKCFKFIPWKVALFHCCLVAQSCWLFDPINCSLSRYTSVKGLSEARLQVSCYFLFQGDPYHGPISQTHVSMGGRWILYHLSHWLLKKKKAPNTKILCFSSPTFYCKRISRENIKDSVIIQPCVTTWNSNLKVPHTVSVVL